MHESGNEPIGADALAASGLICHRIIESMLDHAIMILDTDGILTGWSRGAERLFGYPRGEVLGRSFSLLFNDEDRAHGVPTRELERAREAGRASDERWLVRKDGSRFWASGYLLALRGEDDEPRGFAKVAEDRTLSKRDREALDEEAGRRAEIVALQRDLAAEMPDPQALLTRVVERAQVLTRARGAALLLVEGDHVLFRAASGEAAEQPGLRRRVEEVVAMWSVRHGEALVTGDAPADPRVDATLVRRLGVRSLVVVPLFRAGRAVGVLKIHSNEADTFRADDVETLELLASLTATALALSAERGRLRAVLEALPVGVVIAGADGRLLEVNPAARAVWGAEMPLVESPARYGEYKAWRPDRGQRLEAREWGLARVIAGEPVSTEAEELDIEGFDGRRRSILHYARPIRGVGGRIVGAVAVNVDITERRRAEERLRLLESVVANAHDGVVVTEAEPLDEPGPRILYVNDAFTRLTGYASEEALGRSPRFLQGPDTEAEVRARIREALERRERVRVELTNHRKDGRPFTVEMDIVPVRDARDRVAHFAAVQRDTTERRAAEEAQRRLVREQAAHAEAAEARRRIAAILESITDAFVAFGRDWRFTYVNRRAAETLGHPPEELLGRDVRTTFPQLIGTTVEREVRRAMTERVPVHFEYYAQRLGAWFQVHAHPTEEGLSLYLHDVTERRRAQEGQRRLGAILEATPDVVSTTDVEGHVLYMNQSGRRLLGVGDQPPGRWTIPDLCPDWAAAKMLREAIPAALREGSWTGESAVLGPDGREVPVSQVILAHRGADGEVEFLSTVLRDISAHKHIEEVQQYLSDASRRLAESLEYEAIMRNVLALLVPRLADYCVVDLVGDDDQIRRAGALHRDPGRQALLDELRRFPPGGGRALGVVRTIREGTPQLVPEVTPAWLRAVSRNDEHLRILRALAPRSEMMVPLRVRGRVVGAIVCTHAESGRRHHDEDLRLAEDLAGRAALAIDNAALYRQSRRAVRTRDEVLRVVAHDLRSPIATISLTAQAALEDELSDPELRTDIETMARAAERAHRLIEDLLDVGRIEAGRLAITPAPVAPADIVAEAVAQHRAQAQEKRIALEGESAPDLPSVSADRDRLLQVLANLVGNALKFTPADGRVVIRVAPGDGEVVFAVSDTGTGCRPEQVAHFFDPFWQARPGDRRGTGLGLAICKGIVDAHGGRIQVDSAPGQGTTVEFTVPVTAPPDEAPTA